MAGKKEDLPRREILDIYHDHDVLVGVDRSIPLHEILLRRAIGWVKRKKIPEAQQLSICSLCIYIQRERDAGG